MQNGVKITELVNPIGYYMALINGKSDPVQSLTAKQVSIVGIGNAVVFADTDKEYIQSWDKAIAIIIAHRTASWQCDEWCL